MKGLRLGLAIALASAAACTRAARQPDFETGAGNEARQQDVYTAQSARVRVRRASIEVEVQEVAPAVERATKLANDFEGYVENVMTTEDKAAYLRLRVPSSRLTEALDSLARLGKTTGRSLSEDDVTAQSVDLEARVASLRAARDKLRELLNRAVTVADAVAAQGELARVQGELDSLEAQLKTLQSSVAMSQLTLTLNRRTVLGPLGLVISALASLVGKLFVWR